MIQCNVVSHWLCAEVDDGQQRHQTPINMKNYIPQFIVWCNYISVPEIHAFGTKVLKSQFHHFPHILSTK